MGTQARPGGGAGPGVGGADEAELGRPVESAPMTVDGFGVPESHFSPDPEDEHRSVAGSTRTGSDVAMG